jgi:hypothetical protein
LRDSLSAARNYHPKRPRHDFEPARRASVELPLQGEIKRTLAVDLETVHLYRADAGDGLLNARQGSPQAAGRSHREHDKAAVDAKLDHLKPKLNRGQKTPA